MRSHAYINSVKDIIARYDGSMPLASWLKQFFKANKKSGSTDRKQIAHACYCYFRLGRAFASTPFEERVLIALFLCTDTENIFLKELKPEWNQKILLPLKEKIGFFKR